mmetsp:Transcript_31923/g.85432  ORF Transcript_31923/g.85432 Transcript_31923/m.85432 type:complete len:276 (+) Transcript_31923:1271-2098(+)
MKLRVRLFNERRPTEAWIEFAGRTEGIVPVIHGNCIIDNHRHPLGVLEQPDDEETQGRIRELHVCEYIADTLRLHTHRLHRLHQIKILQCSLIHASWTRVQHSCCHVRVGDWCIRVVLQETRPLRWNHQFGVFLLAPGSQPGPIVSDKMDVLEDVDNMGRAQLRLCSNTRDATRMLEHKTFGAIDLRIPQNPLLVEHIPLKLLRYFSELESHHFSTTLKIVLGLVPVGSRLRDLGCRFDNFFLELFCWHHLLGFDLLVRPRMSHEWIVAKVVQIL